MFNLVMLSSDWESGRAQLTEQRILEFTEPYIRQMFRTDNQLDLEALSRIPCLFMDEGIADEVVRVGRIVRARTQAREVLFEIVFDEEVPPLTNAFIYEHRMALNMPDDFEFSRNHWAVKDVDLYQFLLRSVRPRRQTPTVFQIPEHEKIEPILVSAMMPFHAGFDDVYQSIIQASETVGMRCRRADDIWENPAIIQDVVSLIDRSRIVVCDCTGRNANVFYEAGIAHTLGREVILITQNPDDIPFDLRHLRFIHYLNNGEGRDGLRAKLAARMETIIGH